MNAEETKYILENIGKKSARQISKELNIRERKIKRFLQQHKYKNAETSPNESPKSYRNKKVLFLSVVLIIFLGICAYANSLVGKFILDDEILIQNNPFIRSVSQIANCFIKDIGAGSGIESSFYRPMQMITYILDYAFWGLNVTGYHLTNILLHVLVALSIYWLIDLLYDSRALSVITAALFVVHPIHTEAVSYISGRADSLAALFMLLSFIIYVKQASRSRINMPGYILMLLSYACALLSKESALILLALLLFYHFTFRKKIKWLEFLSLVGVAAIYAIMRVTCLKAFLSSSSATETMYARIPGLFVAIANYGRILFLPFSLHMEYGVKLFKFTDPAAVIGSVITLACLACAYIKRNDKIILFGIGWFFISLLPVSNLYKINAYMAEHFLYVSSIGFFLIIAYLLKTIYNDGRYKMFGLGLIIGPLIFYSALTIKQNYYWREPLAFYERTLKLAPDSPMPYNNMGNAYESKGDYDKAIVNYNKVIELNPVFDLAYYNLGNAYNGKGDYDKAIVNYGKAIELNPDYAEAYNNRGNSYHNKGDYDRAIVDYDKAIELNPGLALSYNSLGNVYVSKGDYDKAIVNYNKVIELKPEFAMYYNNRANACHKKGDYDRAIVDYDKAIELDPGCAMAYYNRAIVYYSKKEYDKAWDDAHKAESLGYKVAPDFIEALKKVFGKIL